MKSIQKFVATIVAFLSILGTAMAQDLPKTLPISSKAELRAYALSQVARGDYNISGPSMFWSEGEVSYVSYQMEPDDDINQLMAMFSNTQFNFRVSDPADKLWVWGNLYDKNWNSLFHAQSTAWTKLKLDGTFDIVSQTAMFKLAGTMPFEVGEDVESAYITGDGGWVYSNVWVDDGVLFFPTSFAGYDGLLVVQSNKDGVWSETTYQINKGVLTDLSEVIGNVSAVMDDYTSYNDEGMDPAQAVGVAVYGQLDGDHEAPVASIKISSANRKVVYYCVIYDPISGKTLEEPTSGWLINKATGIAEEVLLAPGTWTTPTVIEPGEYLFYPETHIYDSLQPIGKG